MLDNRRVQGTRSNAGVLHQHGGQAWLARGHWNLQPQGSAERLPGRGLVADPIHLPRHQPLGAHGHRRRRHPHAHVHHPRRLHDAQRHPAVQGHHLRRRRHQQHHQHPAAAPLREPAAHRLRPRLHHGPRRAHRGGDRGALQRGVAGLPAGPAADGGAGLLDVFGEPQGVGHLPAREQGGGGGGEGAAAARRRPDARPALQLRGAGQGDVVGPAQGDPRGGAAGRRHRGGAHVHGVALHHPRRHAQGQQPARPARDRVRGLGLLAHRLRAAARLRVDDVGRGHPGRAAARGEGRVGLQVLGGRHAVDPLQRAALPPPRLRRRRHRGLPRHRGGHAALPLLPRAGRRAAGGHGDDEPLRHVHLLLHLGPVHLPGPAQDGLRHLLLPGGRRRRRLRQRRPQRPGGAVQEGVVPRRHHGAAAAPIHVPHELDGLARPLAPGVAGRLLHRLPRHLLRRALTRPPG
mmetsp:Transcript_85606/g.228285  ORF Transcript_85606/g.228285 Transcript_85606/m.228285 type:complete len:461 (+) Transcript_85606:381-1763(+)